MSSPDANEAGPPEIDGVSRFGLHKAVEPSDENIDVINVELALLAQASAAGLEAIEIDLHVAPPATARAGQSPDNAVRSH